MIKQAIENTKIYTARGSRRNIFDFIRILLNIKKEEEKNEKNNTINSNN